MLGKWKWCWKQEHIEIIFRSEVRLSTTVQTASMRFYAYKKKFSHSTERRHHPILDVETSSLVNLALALGATVTTQQAVHGPALFAKLDVAAFPLDKVSCIDGTANEQDEKDDSAHKRMR